MIGHRIRSAFWVMLAIPSLALLGWGLWQVLRPLPPYEEIDRLAANGRGPQATALARDWIEARPHDSELRFRLGASLVEEYDRAEEKDQAILVDALKYLDGLQLRPRARQALIALYQGMAHDRLLDYPAAESAYKTALELDPRVPEAGWLLIQHYHRQGRDQEARSLALKLHQREPDPRDKLRFLFELVREDVHKLAARGNIEWFEPVVKANPNDLDSGLALGIGEVREGLVDQGLKRLRTLLESHPTSQKAWRAYLEALETAGQIPLMTRTLEQLPDDLANDSSFLAFQARAAAEQGQFREAAELYRRAINTNPADSNLHFQLAQVLSQTSEAAEAELHRQIYQTADNARKELRRIYEQTVQPDLASGKLLGQVELYRAIAELQEQLGQHEEARAWYRLILAYQPDDTRTRDALARLENTAPQEMKGS